VYILQQNRSPADDRCMYVYYIGRKCWRQQAYAQLSNPSSSESGLVIRTLVACRRNNSSSNSVSTRVGRILNRTTALSDAVNNKMQAEICSGFFSHFFGVAHACAGACMDVCILAGGSCFCETGANWVKGVTVAANLVSVIVTTCSQTAKNVNCRCEP
jgi:hypothetical protein